MKHTILLFLLLFVLKSSWGCSCFPDTNLQSAFDSIDIVFKGTVLSVEPPVDIPRIGIFIQDNFPNYDSTMMETVVAAYNKFHLRWDTISYRTVTIKIEKIYKSGHLLQLKSDSLITIATGKGNGDCGFQFGEGYDYVIWAYEDIYKKYKSPLLSGYATSMCTLTVSLPDIDYIPYCKRMYNFLEQSGQ